ncbi:MAG: phosphatase PAP2 family protein, partial [Candidatus Hodarchaeales archaeon]
TPWFSPQGITGDFSFPSGHTAMGWMLLPLVLLTREKSRKSKILALTVIIAWGLIVALGRIVIGAHYVSDVLFSSCVAFITFLLLEKHYYSGDDSTSY